MRFRFLFMIGVLLSLPVPLLGQELSGVVCDAEGQTPLPYANIAYYALPDTAFVKGGKTSEDGSFSLEGVSLPGILKISYLGYKGASVPVESAGSLGRIALRAEVQELKGVTVTADMINYNARGFTANIVNTPLSKAGMLNDVLRQLPFLSEDGGRISIFGKGEPLYYVDNRRVRNAGELKQLTSSGISKIEVVMNPGAEYPANTEAVIRISTIRKPGEGWSGTMIGQLGFKRRVSYRDYAHLNYRKNDLDIFGDLSYDRPQEKGYYNSILSYGNRTVGSYSAGKSGYDQWLGGLGFNYILPRNRRIGAKYTYMLHPVQTMGCFSTDMVATAEQVQTTRQRWSDASGMRQNYHQLDAYYRHEMPGRKFLQADFSFTHFNGLYGTDHDFDVSQGAPSRLTEDNHFNSWLYAGKVVYGFLLWKSDTQVGAEVSHTKIGRENTVGGNMQTEMGSSAYSTGQNSYAAFIDCFFKLKDFSFNAGLRLEHVNLNYYGENGYDAEASSDYTRLYPTLTMGYRKGWFNTSLSYAYSVTQPSYSQLSNGTAFVSSYVYRVGNPTLKGSFIHKLTYLASWDRLRLIATYRNIRNRIISVYEPSQTADSVLLLRMVNLRGYQSLAVGVSYDCNIGRWKPSWELNYSQQFLSYDGIDYHKPLFSLKWKNMLTLPKDFTLFLNLSCSTMSGDNLYVRHQQSLADFNLSKSFCKGHWQVTLSGTDLFNTSSDKTRMRLREVSELGFGNNGTRGLMFRVAYNFNTVRSNYRGSGAGGEEKSRL